MELNVSLVAGAVSTAIFAGSALPMLHKAFTTRNMKSYSLPSLLLANTGNLVHSLYVFSLPPGPIWALHSFHLITTALMLVWYVRHELLSRRAVAQPQIEGAGG